MRRREFLQMSVAAGAYAVLGTPWRAVAGGEEPWFDRPMRWAQLVLVENDPGFAPAGKSVGVSLYPSRLEPWQALQNQGEEAYNARKEQVAATIADLLDARVPGFKQAIEVVDVVTPVTYQRYTSNWQGSIQGWMPRPGTFRMDDGDVLPHTLPGLAGLYMTGQWVSPGGGVPVAMDGRKVIQRICKVDGRGFHTDK